MYTDTALLRACVMLCAMMQDSDISLQGHSGLLSRPVSRALSSLMACVSVQHLQ